MHTVEIDTPLDASFAVTDHDASSNYYEVRGTLRKVAASDNFRVEGAKIAFRLHDGSFSFSSTWAYQDFKLGQGWGEAAVDGIVLYGFGIEVNALNYPPKLFLLYITRVARTPVKAANAEALVARREIGLWSQKRQRNNPIAGDRPKTDWEKDLQFYGVGRKSQKQPTPVVGKSPMRNPR